ncbi:uncharacterized protein LOC121718516 [Alosa sapidissima]|uniref:uncharacterized protein LOC121718516 n=1 Tax=Alosa sapidissima TaxID=34773 RepID=UPI001C089ABD|nr:uncharacterized protein LOC121718516 [Alosa sapidissima]
MGNNVAPQGKKISFNKSPRSAVSFSLYYSPVGRVGEGDQSTPRLRSLLNRGRRYLLLTSLPLSLSLSLTHSLSRGVLLQAVLVEAPRELSHESSSVIPPRCPSARAEEKKKWPKSKVQLVAHQPLTPSTTTIHHPRTHPPPNLCPGSGCHFWGGCVAMPPALAPLSLPGTMGSPRGDRGGLAVPQRGLPLPLPPLAMATVNQPNA